MWLAWLALRRSHRQKPDTTTNTGCPPQPSKECTCYGPKVKKRKRGGGGFGTRKPATSYYQRLDCRTGAHYCVVLEKS